MDVLFQGGIRIVIQAGLCDVCSVSLRYYNMECLLHTHTHPDAPSTLSYEQQSAALALTLPPYIPLLLKYFYKLHENSRFVVKSGIINEASQSLLVFITSYISILIVWVEFQKQMVH